MAVPPSAEPSAPVVVGVDGSPESTAALAYAVALAERRGRPLRLVHALEPERLASWWTIGWTSDLGAASHHAAVELVDGIRAQVTRDHPDLTVEAAIRDGARRTVLVAEATDADAVVVGSHHSGALVAALRGSTCTELGRQVTCPLIAVPAADTTPTSRSGVVVGVNGTEHSQCTLGYAFAEAAAGGDRLTVVHTWTEPTLTDPTLALAVAAPSAYDHRSCLADERSVLTGCLTGWRDRYPDVEVEECLQRSRPVTELVGRAAGARLLVIGSHGTGSWGGLLGSVGRGVLHAARVPVALVRG